MVETLTAPSRSKSKKAEESKLHYYVLHPSKRSKAKGLHFVSDIKNPDRNRVEIKEEFPRYVRIPRQDNIVINGLATKIRHIKGCPTVFFEEQVKGKWQPKPQIDKIEAIDGGFVVDETRTPELQTYLSLCNFNASNPNRNPDSRPLIQEMNYDKEALKEINSKFLYAKAIMLIEEMSEADAENLIYKYGWLRDPEATEAILKGMLIDIAEENPQFIVDGIKDSRDRRTVVARKAIEKGYIALLSTGVATWQKDGQPTTQIVNVGALGGEDGMFARFVDFLVTDEGKLVLNRMISLVGDVITGDFTGKGAEKPKEEEEETEDEEKDNEEGGEGDDDEEKPAKKPKAKKVK